MWAISRAKFNRFQNMTFEVGCIEHRELGRIPLPELLLPRGIELPGGIVELLLKKRQQIGAVKQTSLEQPLKWLQGCPAARPVLIRKIDSHAGMSLADSVCLVISWLCSCVRLKRRGASLRLSALEKPLSLSTAATQENRIARSTGVPTAESSGAPLTKPPAIGLG